MQIEPISYSGFEEAFRVSNGEVELVVSASAGPRIVRYGFVGGQNLFREWSDGKGLTARYALGDWHIMGGHRLWVAPETVPATYAPDNEPVFIQPLENGLIATPPPEKATGLAKSIQVEMAATGTSITVTHRIRNLGAWSIEIAAWVASVMAQGGVGVTGFPPRGTHPEVLLPTNPLVMWAFSDFTDPRLTLTRKYLVLRQDPSDATPQKFGHLNADTWGAYFLNGDVFLKRYQADVRRLYPDFGSSFEIFTNAEFLELETLGPLEKLAPGESLTHVERWSLHRQPTPTEWNDATLDGALASII